MVDKTFCVGASSCIATYLTAEVMPYVSFAIGVTSLVYMLSKLYYLIKHHGYEVQNIMKVKKMKQFLLKLKDLLLNKVSVAYVLGAITAALGLQIPKETLDSIVCLLPLAGCG